MPKQKSRVGSNPLDWIKSTVEENHQGKIPGHEEKFPGEKRTASRMEILGMIKDNRVSLEEGLKLLKQNRITGEKRLEINYFRENWEESPLHLKHEPMKKGQSSPMLIFDTGRELFEIYKKQPGSNKVVLVKPGSDYIEKEDLVYEINPGNPGNYSRLVTSLHRRGLAPGRILHAWTKEKFSTRPDELALQLEKGIYSLFYLSRALMESKPGSKLHMLYVYQVPGENPQPQYAAVSGFARTIRLENPKFIYKTVEIPGENVVSYASRLLDEFESEGGDEIDMRWGDGGKTRQVKHIKEIQPPHTEGKAIPLKENGVYLITGGAGGLGMIFAKNLAGQAKVNLVLTGRSPLNPRVQAQIKEIESLGSRVLYIPADVSKREDVSALIAAIKSQFKGINGIIHSAGVIRDSYILKKTPAEIEAVLAPKVYGTVYLDEATREENLDFFVMFSSLTAALGNIGQSDYAYANSFMDGYAELRERLRAKQERSGIAISIGWPYWEEGGMSIPAEDRAILPGGTGLKGLSTPGGIKAMENAFRLGIPHCIVAGDNLEKLKKTGTTGAKPLTKSVDPALLSEKAGGFLKKILAEILKLPESRINSEASFERYGIDSILIKMFNVKIENELGPIPKTLLFEHRNLQELTGYFVNNHRDELVKMLDIQPAVPEANIQPAVPAVNIQPEESAAEGKSLAQSRAQAEVDNPPRLYYQEEEIAIIGISGRYPQAKNLEEYWKNLESGKDCITEIPPTRWDYRDNYDPDPAKGKMYCKWGGFLEEIDMFDSLLFNISPREAEIMDPQERIFLEVVWASLEDAGYARKNLKKRYSRDRGRDVGVFAGVTTYTYHLLGTGEMQARSLPQPWSLANRVSYVLDFHGPSIPVDTACSASLTALHLAGESLKKGECAVAVAGGVNLYLHPSKYIGMCLTRMLSVTGRCHTFGEGGDGIVPGEGVGAVVLKPLRAAERDNDHIYAVIKGSSINHGGRTNGYTVPDPNAQANLITDVLARAKINPRTIGYIEAHGTGTVLGDPIEIVGLTKAYREYTPGKQYCPIGSVKSNIGHLESAAGIAGLTKIVLQMKHKRLVPSLHAEKLNPNIDFEASPFYVQREAAAWEQPVIKENGEERTYPRRAGISSFGAGGANAHLILEEYENPMHQPAVEIPGPQVILLSARDENRLKAYAERLAGFLENPSTGPQERPTETGDLEQAVQAHLTRIASALLNVDEKSITLHEPMEEYGIDIVQRMEFSRQIAEIFGIELPPGIIHEINSLQRWTQYLLQGNKGTLQAYYEKNSREETESEKKSQGTGEGENQKYESKSRHHRDRRENQAEDEMRPQQDLSLADIAYTLQVGREEMEWRLALVVPDTGTLQEKLKRYSQGEENIDYVYKGNVKTDKPRIDFLLEGEEGQQIVNRLLTKQKLQTLARLWISGIAIDWEQLYVHLPRGPRRISLPTYPFAKQVHWLPGTVGAGKTAGSRENAMGSDGAAATRLHPLVGINTSTLEEQQFTTRLTGREFFLAEHVVAGRKVLPGVAYIEMAHAAGQIAAKKKILKLKNLMWARPIISDGTPLDVSIRFYPQGETIDYEIGTNHQGNQWTLHACGKLSREIPPGNTKQPGTEIIDIKAIKTRCTGLTAGDECYRLFRSVGLDYGASFRSLLELYYNESEALSILQLPPGCRPGSREFELHPALLDGAQQTVMGLIDRSTLKPGVAYLPFMLGEVELVHPLREKCLAYVTPASGRQEEATGGIKKYDIRLVDETGRVLVKMKDFSLRAFTSSQAVTTRVPKANPAYSSIYFHGVWEERALEEKPKGAHEPNHLLLFGNDRHQSDFILLGNDCCASAAHARERTGVTLVTRGKCFQDRGGGRYEIDPGREEDYRELVEALHRQGKMPGKILHLWSFDGKTAGESTLEPKLEQGIYSLFYLVRAMMGNKPQDVELVYGYPGKEDENPAAYAALGGFVRTLRRENPKFRYKIAVVDEGTEPLALLWEELRAGNGQDIEIRYRNRERYVKGFEEIRLPVGSNQMPKVKEDGVYLVTGGMGGLGFLAAEHLAKKNRVKLVLAGRSVPGPGQEKKIRHLEALGAQVLYIQTDITRQAGVKDLIIKSKAVFKQINGIIHAAGVIRDSYILKKTRAEMLAVLAPKVYGTVWLDEATREEPLDFFIMYSSIAGVLGNPGQGDYAYANSFMDHYAQTRESLRKKGQRQGRTLSMAWPLWKEGGMAVDPQTWAWKGKKFGTEPLETADGLEAFDKMAAAPYEQLALAVGDREKLLALLGIRDLNGITPAGNPGPAARQQQTPPIAAERWQDQVEDDLLKLCEELLKVKPDQVEAEEELGNYGLDSIMMMTMLKRLEEMYGKEVEPYVLAEQNTLRKLAAYLVNQGIAQPGAIGTAGSTGAAAAVTANGAAAEPLETANPPLEMEPLLPSRDIETTGKKSRFITRKPGTPPPPSQEEGGQGIAIIGMACRFPGSNSLESFWENLVKGRDLISEVPAERWKISEYYSPDKKAENKTYCKWGGFLDRIYYFDANFFGVAEADAMIMDPHHRILLELTEELFCRSGIGREEAGGSRTGVYIGGGDSGYSRYRAKKITGDYMKRLLVHKIPNMMAARISDFYNLRGPSLAMDTACSSALAAIHHACRAIRTGECRMAIAGGIELMVDQNIHIEFAKAQVLSDDGACRVFDKRAGGFVPGEGAGLVLLKSYDAALQEGDKILAIIRGSAMNNDGHTMGLTVPSLDGQKEVIRMALNNSGISPDSITYLEAHGTGTLLGDPIEIRAATQVYREFTQARQYCAVGSVKSNMGHLLRAAAIPAVIKIVLAMQNGMIPPTLNCTQPHPRFKFEDSPFYPITAAKKWIPRDKTRRAAVSSFGFGGTNCHMILEEFTDNGTNPMRRTALPTPRFKRKYYCLGEPVKEEPAPAEGFNEAFILDVLEDVQKGKLTTHEAVELI